MRIPVVLATLFALGAGVTPARATSIIFTDADVAGFSVTLTNQGLVSGNLYNVLLAVDTTALYVNEGGVEADILKSISFDLSNANVTATLGVFNTGAGTAWTVPQNSIQNSGNGDCNSTLTGSTCLEEIFVGNTSAGNLFLTNTPQQFTWQFQIDLGAGGAFSSVTSVKVLIADLECKKTPCGTENAYSIKKAELFESSQNSSLALPPVGDPNPVPEPGSLILLGAGLFLVGSRMRRRTN